MVAIDFPPSPTNGQQFVAAGVTWTWDGVKWTALGNNLGIPDAPADSQLYGRKNGSWALATGGGGGIADAPTDGTTYARRSGGWVHLTHTDLTDWATATANFYPTGNPSGYQTAAQVTAALASYYPVSNPSGYIGDAPSDGWSYARENGTWNNSPSFFNNVFIQGSSSPARINLFPDSTNPGSLIVQTGSTKWTMEGGYNSSTQPIFRLNLDRGTPTDYFVANAITGTFTFGVPVTLVGNPVNPLDAATKQYVDALIPSGGPFLPLTGGSLSGNLTIASTAANGGLTISPTTGSAALVLDRPSAAMNSMIDFQSAGVARWRLYSPTNEAETGGNAGSNFQLWRFSDTGVSLGQVLGINRATGAATLSGGLSAASITAPQVIGDNRIINGDMRIDQRNNGAAVTPTGQSYTIDRWALALTQPSKVSAQRTAASATMQGNGFQYVLTLTCVAALFPPAASDSLGLYQSIEADMLADLAWGTGNAQPITLSFWAYASVGGTFAGAIRNTGATRSYPFSFTMGAGAWNKFSITIPGDTGGPWVLAGAGTGLSLVFSLCVGTTFCAPAYNVWTAGNYVAGPSPNNVLGAVNNTFLITGVKLEIGNVATPFNRQSLAKSMADCQRYFWLPGNGFLVSGCVTGVGAQWSQIVWPTTMRAAPTVTFGGSPTLNNCSAPTVNWTFPDQGRIAVTASAAGIFSANLTGTTVSAEL